jgi:hypothetical protein
MGEALSQFIDTAPLAVDALSSTSPGLFWSKVAVLATAHWTNREVLEFAQTAQ